MSGTERAVPIQAAGLHWFDLLSHTFLLYVCVCVFTYVYMSLYIFTAILSHGCLHTSFLWCNISLLLSMSKFILIKRIFRFWWGRRIKSLKALCSLLKIQHLHTEDKEGRKRTWEVKSGSLVTFSPFEPESLDGRMTLNHESKHLLSVDCQLGTTVPSIS